jgi:NAD-dependent DNA ligase
VEDVPAAMPQDLGDLTRKTVCFTGESACTVGGLPMSRPTQEILATNAGLHVLPRVTKKLDLLVVSPLVERTGKVAKAELYGILRVDESAFWRAIGVKID